MKNLANFRKNSPALTTGKFMQYVPENGVYVYFRYTDNQSVMCMLNTSDKLQNVDLRRFKERLAGFKSGREIQTNTLYPYQDVVTIEPRQSFVFELNK